MTRMIAAVATMFALVSCSFVQVNGKLGGKYIKGDGETVVKSFDIKEIKSFTCNVPAELTLTNGAPSLEISTYENVHQNLSVVNEGDELVIKGLDECNFRDTKIRINLSCGLLDDIEFNGAVDLKTPEGLAVGDLDLEVNGAFNWETENVTGRSLKLEVDGAGNCEITGVDLQNLDIEVDGAGNFKFEGKAVKARIELNGAGNIDVSKLQSDDIDSEIHGLGRVKRN